METEMDQPGLQMQDRVYRCYLLRCWQEVDAGAGGEPMWRFSVRHAGSDAARCAFVSLGEVEAYIQAELVACTPAQKQDPATHT